MTMKLTQRLFLKGTREFEIIDDTVNVRIKRLLKEDRLTVGLSTLNPHPVVNKPYLQFYGRARQEPLLSLFLNKPNAEAFDAFVDTLAQRALEEYDASVGAAVSSDPARLAGNVYEEPPEFADSDQKRPRNNGQPVDAAKVDNAIKMLETYMVADDIEPLLAALEALKAEPQSESNLMRVEEAFNDLGHAQGAVLTYAPYISALLSDDPFKNL